MKPSFLRAVAVVVFIMVSSGCQLERHSQLQSESIIKSDKSELYRLEIDELVDNILREHPRPFRIVDEESFKTRVLTIKETFDITSTRRDLFWHYSEILASLGCGHSNMFYFNQEDRLIDIGERFPMDVRLIDNKLIVLDPLSNSHLFETGDQISEINGQKVPNIINKIFNHISADLDFPHRKRHAFNSYATSYLTYALNFPESYSVLKSQESQPVTLSSLTTFSHKPIISPLSPCQEILCYGVDENTNSGILTLRSFNFYGDRGQIFADHIDSAFEELVENSRDNLVIDLRGNGGGSGLAGAYVLRRIAEKPFVYFSDSTDTRAREELLEVQMPVETGFNGKVFVLMDGNTGSSVPHFIALVKENDLGILVGETAGGNKSTTDGAKQFISSGTGIEYKIARMRFDAQAPGQSEREPLEPDIVINYTIKQTITGEDIMMEDLLTVISKTSKP